MPDIDPASSGLPQQEVWRKRLEAAELAFNAASLALATALQDQDRSGSDATGLAGTRARKAKARTEYLRVLRIFTELVLRGKLPE